jgi:hypothetical protein
MESNIEKGIRLLKESGHTVQERVRDKSTGTFWFDIDQGNLVSEEEMAHLGDGMYSLTELIELFRKRRAEEKAN